MQRITEDLHHLLQRIGEGQGWKVMFVVEYNEGNERKEKEDESSYKPTLVRSKKRSFQRDSNFRGTSEGSKRMPLVTQLP